MSPVSAIGRALAAAGRPVARCPACGREFDPSSAYDGGHHGGLPRLCCSTPCRDRTRLERRTTLRGHRTTWHDLAERHRLETAGQLALTGVLPAVPQPPPPPSRFTDEPLPLGAPA